MNAIAGVYPGDAAAILTLTLAAQIALVVGIAALVARCIGSRNAAAVYGIWFSALLCIPLGAAAVIGFHETGAALISLPVLAPEGETDDEAASCAVDTVSGKNGTPADERGTLGTTWFRSAGQMLSPLCPTANSFRVLFVAFMAIWTAGVFWLSVRTVRGLWLLASVRRTMRSVGRGRLGEMPEQVRSMLGMQVLPAIMTSRRIGSPISLGILQPVIVLPEDLLAKLSPQALRDVLIHECAHFLKRDHWVGLLERFVQITAWPHPAIHVLRRELDRAREEVCDNYVLRSGDVPCYARTLLEISRHSGSRRQAMSPAIGILDGHWLERRVAGMLDKQRKLVTRINRAVLGTALVAFLLADLVLAGVKLVPRQPEPVASKAPVTASLAKEDSTVVVKASQIVEEEPSRTPTRDSAVGALAAALTPVSPASTAPAIAHAPSEQAPAPRENRVATRLPEPKRKPAEQPAKTPVEAASVVQVAAAKDLKPSEGAADDSETTDETTWVAQDVQPAATSVAFLQPAMRIDRVNGSYVVALRVDDEPQPLFSIEAGKTRTINFSSSICDQISLTIIIEPEARSNQARSEDMVVSYRLAVQIDPETIRVWEVSRAACRPNTWTLLVPRAVEPPVQSEAEVQEAAAAPATPASATSFSGVRRFFDGAMRAISPEGM